MSDADARADDATDSAAGAANATAETSTDAGSATDRAEGRNVRSRVRRAVDYVLVALLVLFAFVAAVQFYFNVQQTISYWVADEYVSVFQAAFNLAVLLVVAVGLSRQLDRML